MQATQRGSRLAENNEALWKRNDVFSPKNRAMTAEGLNRISMTFGNLQVAFDSPLDEPEE
jgi:hypothetical protein